MSRKFKLTTSLYGASDGSISIIRPIIPILSVLSFNCSISVLYIKIFHTSLILWQNMTKMYFHMTEEKSSEGQIENKISFDQFFDDFLLNLKSQRTLILHIFLRMVPFTFTYEYYLKTQVTNSKMNNLCIISFLNANYFAYHH